MRCAIVLLALATFGAALPQQQQQKQQAADQGLLKKQQDCILLLQQITQEIPNEQLQILGTTYDIENNYQQYENPILIKYYVGAVQAGLVQPKGTIYSNSISQLRKEISLLHRILLGAKNYQTFLATAAWARVHVNEGQFVKAFIGAVLQHPETQDIVLPPLYEIVPQHYFDARIIQEVQNIVAQGVSYSQVVIPVNYSAQLSNSDQQLSYFTQDIGLANYYGYVNLAGYLLESIYDYTPSILELGSIAVYDPAFYQLYQNVIQLFKQYQNSLPAYQYNDILLPGVSIQNVQISPLITLFNNYYVDLDAASQHQVGQQQQVQQQQQQQQHIKAQVKRLDHKPYEYQITVQSEQNIPGAVVRVYLGPKHDYNGKPISISQHRHQFVELDQFITDLQQGQNVIVRQSQQAPGQSHDYPSVQEIKQGVNNAVHAQEPYYITEPHQIFGFPARLALPKAQQGQGFPVQLFVVISQPGQQNVPYGPVIPEQYQTYQQNQYQVVGTEDYQQIQHQGSKVVGIKQTVEVVPETLPIGQQENQVIRNHYANLYTQQHGQYPYTHSQYQVGQGQVYGQEHNVYGVQGQQGQHGQQGQYIQGQPQHQWDQWSQGIYQGQQGQYQHDQQSTVGVQGGVPTGIHGLQQNTHKVQGVQSGVQGVQDVQGVQGTQQGNQGVYSSIQSGIQGKYHVTYQGQSQQQQGLGVGYTGSGQYHAGGFQGILGQEQKTQDAYVKKYYQNKHISEIIGGAISLDGKPLGYPLDRPLTTGALSVSNVYVQTVLIHHEGQPTNEVYYQ